MDGDTMSQFTVAETKTNTRAEIYKNRDGTFSVKVFAYVVYEGYTSADEAFEAIEKDEFADVLKTKATR